MGKLIVANYKMNGDKELYRSVNKLNKIKRKDTTLVLCPPFVYLSSLIARNFYLGAQDVYESIVSKPTGEISVNMLTDLGVKYVIVGHSERRALGETDRMVADKVALTLEHNIIPIVCVGELSNANINDIKAQVDIVARVSNNNVIFAYEPVWAIGTGKVPTIQQIDKVINLIKSVLKKYKLDCKILYGGSVNLANYKELLESKADGFLIGGLSLKLDQFIEVLKGVDNV